MTLISSFILFKLDYCNITITGLPCCILDQLQSVINATTCLTIVVQRYYHITLLLAELHWLWMPQHIRYIQVMCTVHTVYSTDPPENVICPAHLLNHSVVCTCIVSESCSDGDCAFAVTRLQAWNGLPDAIHWTSLLAAFKPSLKT